MTDMTDLPLESFPLSTRPPIVKQQDNAIDVEYSSTAHSYWLGLSRLSKGLSVAFWGYRRVLGRIRTSRQYRQSVRCGLDLLLSRRIKSYQGEDSRQGEIRGWSKPPQTWWKPISLTSQSHRIRLSSKANIVRSCPTAYLPSWPRYTSVLPFPGLYVCLFSDTRLKADVPAAKRILPLGLQITETAHLHISSVCLPLCSSNTNVDHPAELASQT